VEKQILAIFAGTKGYLDPLPLEMVQSFEKEMYKYFDINNKDIQAEILKTGDVSDDLMKRITDAMDKFQAKFMKDNKLEMPEQKGKELKPA
jgi:F-type H+-transporting ATPase subunit alpha